MEQIKKYISQYLVFILLVGSIFLFSFEVSNPKKCTHRNIPYSTADYSEYDKQYAHFFDNVAKNKFDKCICGEMPELFNSKIKYTEHTSIVIEPLFVDLQNCNGIYAQRIYGKYSPLYSNHKYPHRLFVIKNKEFIELNDLDSIQIKSVLISDDVFAEMYTQAEIDSIYSIVKYGTVWTYTSGLAPYYVKDKGKKIYDAFHE